MILLSSSSHVGKVLHDRVIDFIRRYVGDVPLDELKNVEGADSEHLRLSLWRRIEFECPAVGNLD